MLLLRRLDMFIYNVSILRGSTVVYGMNLEARRALFVTMLALSERFRLQIVSVKVRLETSQVRILGVARS